MEGFLILLGLGVLAVPVLLVVALVSLGGLKRRVLELEDTVGRLGADLAELELAAGRRAHDASATPRGDRVQAARAGASPHAPPSPGPGPEPWEQAAPTAADSVEAAGAHAAQQVQSPLDAAPHPAAAADTAAADGGQARTGSQPHGSRASTAAATDGAQPPPLPSQAAARTAQPASAPTLPLPPTPPRRPPPGDGGGAFLRAVRRWFTVGNVPVKVGMLVLLAGVAALLRYASEQGWLQLPIELRLAGVALAALAGLVFGWRQRERRPAFALALQGGAIGVLLLVVFAAFKLYDLVPAGAAFALSIVLVAGLGVLAVLQDSRTMAALGIVAGFLAPVWLSTGAGSHVALFSYYALLNAAIFGIAWVKSWRALNLLGFVFTWGIGLAWGVLAYTPENRASTQPFLVLFFAFYLLLPILFARRQPASRRDLVDGCLVFGTPLVAFSLQAALLDGARLPLAYCALALAALYAALAWALRRGGRHLVLTRAYALLAVGFATLSVPLALSAQATASVFALEGAALVWLGLRQRRMLPQLAGAGLQLAAAVAYMAGRDGMHVLALQPLANPEFMGMLLIALAGFASAWSCRAAGRPRIALAYYLWGLAWWGSNLYAEIDGFVVDDARLAARFAATVLTGWLAAEAFRPRPERALGVTALLALAAAVPFALAQADAHGHPFAGAGAWAWLAYALLGVRSLMCLRGADRSASWAQFAWWLAWPLSLSLYGTWLLRSRGFGEGWTLAAAAVPWIVLLLATVRWWPLLRMRGGAGFDLLRPALQSVLGLLLGLWWLGGLFAAGDPLPVAWVPVLNPLELLQAALLVALARWLWSGQAGSLEGARVGLVAGAGFVLLTAFTLRSVHHWGDVPWDASLAGHMLAQTSLTLVWSLLGMVGWIWGSRRGQRTLWLVGALLMGVVLAKLVLVDRQHLGDLLGIGSFIAYGLLCMLVGYFAPAPPRATAADDGAAA